MLSKVKDLMGVGSRVDEASGKIKELAKDISAESKEMAAFRKEVAALKSEVSGLNTKAEESLSAISAQMDEIHKTNEEFKKELYDFKMIKSDIKSKLVSELSESFREELKNETRKLDVDVKAFNDLKEELCVLVTKFKAVESEVAKFKEIAGSLKSADFQLANYARELTKNDQEKLRLMEKVEHLERLVAKERRGRN
jgi:chromosome segregation ATPase